MPDLPGWVGVYLEQKRKLSVEFHDAEERGTGDYRVTRILVESRTLLPLRSAVMIQSEQKRCKHSFVVMVFLSMSRQIGHISSLCKLRGLTAISVLSVIAS